MRAAQDLIISRFTKSNYKSLRSAKLSIIFNDEIQKNFFLQNWTIRTNISKGEPLRKSNEEQQSARRLPSLTYAADEHDKFLSFSAKL